MADYYDPPYLVDKTFSAVDGRMRLDDDVIKYALDMKNEDFQDPYQNFTRYYTVRPDEELSSFMQYVFITRPDCNVIDDSNTRKSVPSVNSADSFLQYMVRDHAIVCKWLTENLTANHFFIPITHRIESLGISDYTIKDYSINQPYSNYQIPYGGIANESITGGSFDITFREDSELRITKLFQLWVYYINSIMKNTLKTKDNYRRYHCIDYACSVYNIICKPDAKTILYWSKYTGCFPTSVPHSNYSFNLHSNGPENKVSIPFRYFIQEHMRPEILIDFNQNSPGINGRTPNPANDAPYYDSYGVHSASSSVGPPYIYRSNNGSCYELRWQQKTSTIHL